MTVFESIFALLAAFSNPYIMVFFLVFDFVVFLVASVRELGPGKEMLFK